jgi:hypothetical protein
MVLNRNVDWWFAFTNQPKEVTAWWPPYGFLQVNSSGEINLHTYMFPLKYVQ